MQGSLVKPVLDSEYFLAVAPQHLQTLPTPTRKILLVMLSKAIFVIAALAVTVSAVPSPSAVCSGGRRASNTAVSRRFLLDGAL